MTIGSDTAGQDRRDDAEGLFFQDSDGFCDGGEVVEDVLCPCRNVEGGLALRGAVVGDREVKQVGDQALLVDAVGGGGVVEGRNQAAVFRRPFEGVTRSAPFA